MVTKNLPSTNDKGLVSVDTLMDFIVYFSGSSNAKSSTCIDTF